MVTLAPTTSECPLLHEEAIKGWWLDRDSSALFSFEGNV